MLTISEKRKKIVFFIYAFLVMTAIYLFFLKWKLVSVHDDDLYIYKTFLDQKTLNEQLNVSLIYGQYRPIRDLFLYVFLKWVNLNFTFYFVFNVVVQAINTVLFAWLLSRVLRSIEAAMVLALGLGLSRFCFYNVTQLFNGGILEGLAMTFFLCFLQRVFTAAEIEGVSVSERSKAVLWSILFANLSMYTHERYIMLLVFLIGFVLLHPGVRMFSMKYKAGLLALLLLSIGLNIYIKTSVFHMTFMKGTGSTEIKVSSSVLNYLLQAVTAVVQFNTGPEYLVGMQIWALPVIYKLLVCVILILMIMVLGVFMWRGILAFVRRKGQYPDHFALFILSGALFFMMLVPVVTQVKLELRWYQAPLVTLLFMFSISIRYLFGSDRKKENQICILLGVAFLATNYYYIDHGAKNLYYSTTARIGNVFDQTVKDGVIHKGVDDLYIWERRRDPIVEAQFGWALAGGNFFIPYQGKGTRLIFLDSLYTNDGGGYKYSFADFDKQRDQVIYLDVRPEGYTLICRIADITKEFLKDSLETYSRDSLGKAIGDKTVHYQPGTELTFGERDLGKYVTEGFYDSEGGFRWTNGNARLTLSSAIKADDTIQLSLTTYMPPVCKNVHIRSVVVGRDGRERVPVREQRTGDKFDFFFDCRGDLAIKEIRFLSDTIYAGRDLRRLSFPFISLRVKF